MAKAEHRIVFLLYLISFFHSETDWKKKKLVAEPGIEPGPLILSTTILSSTSTWLLQMALTFSILPNPFFHSETNVKVLVTQPGINPPKT